MKNKGKISTLLLFMLSFCVVFGGWFLTKRLLNYRMEEFLDSTGQIVVNLSEITLLPEETANPTEFQGTILSEEMIEKVLIVWEEGGYKQLHEPLEGQMTMEQAIAAGRNWIAVLSEKGILPYYLKECSFDKTDAKLCTLDLEVSFEKTLLSLWEIEYIEQNTKIILSIHAASGQIWKADISMNEDEMIYGGLSDGELLNVAFPFMPNESTESKEVKNIVYKCFPNKKVYAAVSRSQFVVNEQKPISQMILWLCTENV